MIISLNLCFANSFYSDTTITTIGVVLLVLAVLAVMLKGKHNSRNTDVREFPYQKKYLLTRTEYAFYKILKEQCDKHNLLICPKVRMEDFIQVTASENRNKYRGYIKSRHIDFILCDDKLQMLAGLELDDNSHLSEKAQQTDEFKNQVFEAIGLPLYRIKTSDGMFAEQISKILDELTT